MVFGESDVDDRDYHQWSSQTAADVPRSRRVRHVNFGFLTCARSRPYLLRCLRTSALNRASGLDGVFRRTNSVGGRREIGLYNNELSSLVCDTLGFNGTAAFPRFIGPERADERGKFAGCCLLHSLLGKDLANRSYVKMLREKFSTVIAVERSQGLRTRRDTWELIYKI